MTTENESKKVALQARRTAAAKTRFLKIFAESGNIADSCRAAKVHRSTHYEWLKTDLAYGEAFAVAEQDANDALETEARRRATQGVKEPVFYLGEKCGSVTKYSDTLLIFLMKGANPKKYRERIEHSGPNGKAIAVQRVADTELDARIAALEEQLKKS